MGSYTVEQVEFLRQRADITYEEALEVLERCNGDLTRCLVDLERRGKIRKTGANAAPKTARANTTYRRAGAQEGSSLSALIKKLVRMHLVVTKENNKNGQKTTDTCLDLPVLFLIIVALCAPHLALICVVLMFVFGMKIRVENNEGEKVGNEQFYSTVDKVADNIKNTVSNFAHAAQANTAKARRADVENHTPYQAQEENVVYAQPAEETVEEPEAPIEETAEPEIDVDIPEVTPYEAFDGTQCAPENEPPADTEGEENEITIG